MSGTSDVAVVGAGPVGLAVAWRAAQHGMTVTVIDPAPGSGAWHAAAGMLAPVTELHYEGRDLLALALDSAARYPAFVAELTAATGLEVGYRRCGTLAVGWDAADLAALRDLHAFQLSCGVASELVAARELRDREPALAADLPGGLWAADDHQVDPRLLHAALLAAATGAGARLLTGRVTGLLPGGVRTDSGEQVAAGTVVLAAGAWSGALAEVPVRPVKGQTVRLRAAPGLIRHVVRGTVRGSPVYLVPRADGSLVVGASSEEAGFDRRARTGAVFDLLRDAQALVPELSEAEFVEVSTGLRPGTPDNAPLIGRAARPGLIYATGHYRNGVLLTPVTADLVLGLLTGAAGVPPVCDPARFAGQEVLP